MKKIFLIIVTSLCFCSATFSQSDNFAELQGETLYLKNGTVLHEDDYVRCGVPTGKLQNYYENIFHEPNDMLATLKHNYTDNANLTFEGKELKIKKFKYVKQKDEKIWILVLRNSEKNENLICLLKNALESGEIVPVEKVYRRKDVTPKPEPVVVETPKVEQKIDNSAEIERQKAEEKAEKESKKAAEKVEKERIKAEEKAAKEQEKIEREKAKAAEKANNEKAKNDNVKNDNTKQNFSVADEIRKLKALCDEGIISKEEFERQKEKLLK